MDTTKQNNSDVRSINAIYIKKSDAWSVNTKISNPTEAGTGTCTGTGNVIGTSTPDNKPGTSNPTNRRANSEARATLAKKNALQAKPTLKDKRAAVRLMDRLKQTPEAERTAQQKNSLNWATKVMESEDATQAQTQVRSDVSVKRKLSQEEVAQPLIKRPRERTCTQETISEIIANNIVVAVVDQSDPDGSITPERWGKVEIRLATAFLPILKEHPGNAPSCRDVGWHQGFVKLIACADQRSVDLYKIAMSGVGEPWPGAKLEVVDLDDIPNRPRARSWIPAEPSDPQTILEIIRASNPDLDTGNWKVTRLDEPKGETRSVTFVINPESTTPMLSSGGVLSYGFSSIKMRVFKKEEDAKKDMQQTSALDVVAVSESNVDSSKALTSNKAQNSVGVCYVVDMFRSALVEHDDLAEFSNKEAHKHPPTETKINTRNSKVAGGDKE